MSAYRSNQPWERSAAAALAWMPAPPDESLPVPLALIGALDEAYLLWSTREAASEALDLGHACSVTFLYLGLSCWQ